MGSVDDALPRTALTSARRPCLHFHCAFWFPRQRARAHVALLGPCFKTGRTRPSGRLNTGGTGTRVTLTATRSRPRFALRAVHTAPFTRVGRPPFGVCHGGQGLPIFLGRAGAPYDGAVSCRHGRARVDSPSSAALWLRSNRRWSVLTRSTALPREDGAGRSPSPRRHPRQGLNLRDHCTNLVRFPPDGFTYCLTLFSKCFSSFLTVLVRYRSRASICFRWSLPPILGCNPKQPDSSGTDLTSDDAPTHGALTLSGPPFRTTLGTSSRAKLALQTTIAGAGTGDFKFELFPLRSPLLRESLLVSFPSAY